jgi:L-alanine-DL-glutamate epimerase-like enolase superfamily enzyme
MDPSRREFLRAAAGGGSLTSLGGLAKVRSAAPPDGRSFDAVEAALARVREKTGLKVRRIETFTRDTTVSVVRVTTDDGTEGIGQTAPFDADITATVLHRKIAPHVLGRDPAEFEALAEECVERNYKYPWSFVCRALAGVDTALWDLLGKKHGRGVCELLGGRPRPVGVYGSSMRRDITPADEARRLAMLRDERGFAAFKVRVGKVTGHDQDQWPGRTEELIPAVRRAVGDKVRLQADANSCYSPKKAIEVGRRLEANGYYFFEEPCPYWELEWTAEVAAALDMKVAGGEQDNDLAQWRRMFRLRAVDVAQPDVCYVGGLTRALQVARSAAGAGLLCVPHSANLSLVTVFTLHLMAAIPNAGDHVEYSIEETPWTCGLFSPALAVHDGRVAVPSGPGWGVTVPPEWLEKSARQVSELK